MATKGKMEAQQSSALVLDAGQRQIAPPQSSAVEMESQRAVAEVQAAMAVAKRFPRDVLQARQRVLMACSRPSLAEQATYAYQRGSTIVKGASIRLAEAIAQNWGNIKTGVQELGQHNGVSTVRAYAWDLETGYSNEKVFEVPHLRFTKEGITKLSDPRDIYEMVANQGARRLRACILGVIPGDIVDEAVDQCETTLANAGGAPAEQMKKLVGAFAEIGVSADALQQKLGHSLSSAVMAEVIRLRQVFGAIRDGMTTVDAEFKQGAATSQSSAPPKTAKEAAARAAQAARPKDDAVTEQAKSFAHFEFLIQNSESRAEAEATLADAKAHVDETLFALLRKMVDNVHPAAVAETK